MIAKRQLEKEGCFFGQRVLLTIPADAIGLLVIGVSWKTRLYISTDILSEEEDMMLRQSADT